jgi:thiamine-phosphate pyrophosphorylase
VKLSGFYAIVGWDGVVDKPVAHAVALAEQLLAGGACALQVRLKKAPLHLVIDVARAVGELARAASVPLVVNDRLDVALAVGADAVHLGQDDLPIAAARVAAAGRLAIGLSTHSPAQAEAGARAGADYLGFGPVFATRTKENPDPVQGVDALAEAVRRAGSVPVVAIGGIGLDTVHSVARAGAAAACVVAAVNLAPDVVAAARRIGRPFEERRHSAA